MGNAFRTAFFDMHRYERESFDRANAGFGLDTAYFEPRLSAESAALAAGFGGVCAFVNDRLDAEALRILHAGGTRLIALRCAGYNQVDLESARSLGMRVVRVPEYSPYAVAEHAIALALALNRRIHRAYARVREGNFTLDGLVGFDLHGKTAGVVGTGRIGRAMVRILRGFGCGVLVHDVQPDRAFEIETGARYVDLPTLLAACDLVSLHVPLTARTRHLIGRDAIAQMKPGVMLINTGRGGLVDTSALIEGLKSGQVGAAGLDVYEQEAKVFFQDWSDRGVQDDVLARLLTFPNVVVTSHQAFLTHEALHNIAVTTLTNLDDYARGRVLLNEVTATP